MLFTRATKLICNRTGASKDYIKKLFSHQKGTYFFPIDACQGKSQACGLFVLFFINYISFCPKSMSLETIINSAFSTDVIANEEKVRNFGRDIEALKALEKSDGKRQDQKLAYNF